MSDDEFERELRTWSETDGFYQFAELSESEYLVRVAERSSYPSTKLLVRAGVTGADLVVPELKGTLAIYGWIKNRAGHPLEGTGVMLIGHSGVVAHSDPDGYYELSIGLSIKRRIRDLRFQHDAHRPQTVEIDVGNGTGIDEKLQVDIVLERLQTLTSVTGQVRNSQGAPVIGETVWLYSAQVTRHYSATTDSAGRFVISKVASATDYRVQVRPREQYRDYSRENVQVSGSVMSLDVLLEAEVTGSLIGQMLDPESNPIPHFNLWLRSRETIGQPIQIRGDGAGNFNLEGAPAGELIFHSRSAPQIQISGIYLPPGEEREVALVVDWGHHELKGWVMDDDNNPIPGAALLLTWSQQEDGLRSRSIRKATADRDGNFRFTQLGYGRRTLSVEAQGFEPLQVEQHPGTGTDTLELRLVPAAN